MSNSTRRLLLAGVWGLIALSTILVHDLGWWGALACLQTFLGGIYVERAIPGETN